MNDDQSKEYRNLIRGAETQSDSTGDSLRLKFNEDDNLDVVDVNTQDLRGIFDIESTEEVEADQSEQVRAMIRGSMIQSGDSEISEVSEFKNLLQRHEMVLDMQSEFEQHKSTVESDMDELKLRVDDIEEGLTNISEIESKISDLRSSVDENSEQISRLENTVWYDLFLPASLAGSILLTAVTIWLILELSIAAIPAGILTILIWTAVWQLRQQ